MAESMEAHHQLYGGAMAVILPANFLDSSKVRQVPDNQEIFMHPSTDQSIIIELMEYQQVDDPLAARYHFEDIAGDNDSSSVEIISEEVVPLSEVTMKQCASVWLLHGKQMVSKFNEEAKNTLIVYIALFRLPQYTTDILVTFNNPMQISPESSSSKLNNQQDSWTMAQFKQVICSLNLIDSSLLKS
ncbi:ran guanine nucleotide release factor-like [Anneissia japonica]|uniref:ran guanine nucleotide release factor-like n=1 Tax=Anneissia japonica TaxID=1529436 RepID=UPI001425681D|nr:ran guanine nucleotide release factor-like [Anneissia japonica]XP_033107636.1 ran guanine nucleotide release factor-like [Anneissia japonica]